MLTIEIPEREFFDDNTNEFIFVKGQKLQLEHSLVSISKWEAKWHKAFLSTTEKTPEEVVDYIRCMTLTQNVNPKVYKNLTQENLNEVSKYINDSMSATKIPERITKAVGKKDTLTSELLYYYMVALQIPFECQKWHLNRLIMLIQVCNIKNNPKKNKMSKNEMNKNNAAIRAANRAKMHK